jgi:hypothetical protein
MAFLPPSFIVITGFLISRVYFTRPEPSDARTRMRLMTRGLKLVVLFTLLNVLGNLVSNRNYNGQTLGLGVFLENGFDIYVMGDGRWAAFEVLLPIAYLLLLGPLWLWLERWNRVALPAVSFAIVVVCFGLEHQGRLIPNLAMLSAGLMGLLLGRLPETALERLGRYWLVGVMAYGLHTWIAMRIGQSYGMQMAGACIALAAFYGIGCWLGARGWIQQRINVLGCYSLVSYVSQIAILQIMVRWTGRPELASPAFLFLFFATLMIMALTVETIHWARHKSDSVNTAYKVVFA